MNNSDLFDLREAAQRIRETPRCTDHKPCDCAFWERTAQWLDGVASDFPFALETAQKILAATERAPKAGLDFLPEPSALSVGSSLKVVR